MTYKLCSSCGQPVLKRGQRRQNAGDYRHARGCPKASVKERAQTEKMWAGFEKNRR